MIYLTKELMRLKPAYSMGVGALKLKFFVFVLAILGIQIFVAYQGYQDVLSAMNAGRSWGAYILIYGFFFFMAGWVAVTLTARLSYAAVVFRNIRKKDPLF